MLGQLVDHLDARQIRRQRLALAAALGGRSNGFLDDVGIDCLGERLGQAFRLVEQRQLRRGRVRRLFGLAAEQALAE
ncbi:hypothetical protein D3C85_1418540 [compost metagenome]